MTIELEIHDICVTQLLVSIAGKHVELTLEETATINEAVMHAAAIHGAGVTKQGNGLYKLNLQ